MCKGTTDWPCMPLRRMFATPCDRCFWCLRPAGPFCFFRFSPLTCLLPASFLPLSRLFPDSSLWLHVSRTVAFLAFGGCLLQILRASSPFPKLLPVEFADVTFKGASGMKRDIKVVPVWKFQPSNLTPGDLLVKGCRGRCRSIRPIRVCASDS